MHICVHISPHETITWQTVPHISLCTPCSYLWPEGPVQYNRIYTSGHFVAPLSSQGFVALPKDITAEVAEGSNFSIYLIQSQYSVLSNWINTKIFKIYIVLLCPGHCEPPSILFCGVLCFWLGMFIVHRNCTGAWHMGMFWQGQPTSHRAEQVKVNSLAVRSR